MATVAMTSVSAFAAGPVTELESNEHTGSGYAAIVTENDVINPYLRADSQYVNNSKGTRVGYWIQGKRDNNVVSEYKSYVGDGRASVINGEGYHVDGGWKGTEVWSKASKNWTSKGTNKANYDYR